MATSWLSSSVPVVKVALANPLTDSLPLYSEQSVTETPTTIKRSADYRSRLPAGKDEAGLNPLGRADLCRVQERIVGPGAPRDDQA
jgi:hypothetical protein